jgi:regulator of protease activity HflC (stomatin/prohibitin superfamily)
MFSADISSIGLDCSTFLKGVFMKYVFSLSSLATAILVAGAFTLSLKRIETGEVGVRVGFDKQVKPGELQPGSFNQTLVGDVLTFPVKDVAVAVDNMTPLAKDNSTMKDVDMTVIYSINPSQVSELYTSKNKSFHAVSKEDTLLMYNYVFQAARNGLYKATREFEALDMNDNRSAIEQKVREAMAATLASEKLDTSITIQQVLIRQMTPADSVVASANDLVRAKNELKQKEVEVKTAEAEARRMAALANNSAQSVQFMQAQAMLNISEGIKNGKVQTIVVPSNFTALMTTK